MRDIKVQKLIDTADALKNNGKYQEAIGVYLEVLKEAKKDWQDGIRNEAWQKKAIFMACNGMGISYAKWGKVIDAIDNFADAVLYAPNEEAKKVAKSNLEKYQEAVKNKTMGNFVSRFID